MEEYSDTGIKILEAAKTLFSENGYSAVSTKKIATNAKVNEVTLFRIFGNKEKLFESTFTHFFFRPDPKMLDGSTELSLEGFLYQLGEFLHHFFTSNLTLIKIELRNQDKVLKERINKFPNEIKIALSKQFQKHKNISKKAADLEAVCFMTALHGLCLNIYVFKTITSKVKFEECLNITVEKFK